MDPVARSRSASSKCRSWRRPPRLRERPTLPSFLYFPSDAGTASRPDAPALERHARGRRRHLRSRPGALAPAPADRVCQVLAGEPCRGSHGSFAALGDRGRPSPVAGARRRRASWPTCATRGITTRRRHGRSRCPSRAATDRLDRARVVRRRSPRADRAGGAAGGTGARDPPRGAYRRALLVDRRAPPRSCDRPVRRRTGAGVRRGWRDHGLQSDARDDRRQGAHIRTDCHRRAPAAWRRQPRSRARDAGGGQADGQWGATALPHTAAHPPAEVQCREGAAPVGKRRPGQDHHPRRRPECGRWRHERRSDEG